MDMEKVSSANELTVNQDSVLNLDHNNDEIRVNGSCANEDHDVDTRVNIDSSSSHNDGQVQEGNGDEQVVYSEPLSAKFLATGSPPLSKGFGLRKWRRIKRDVVKDAGANADSSKVLKRGLSASGNPSKPANIMSGEIRQKSEGSVGSTNVLRNVGVLDGLVALEANMESKFALGPSFPAGEDSENSEDRSSKSSTAASAPRMRYDLPAVLQYVREKNRIKNLSGKNIGTSSQRVQQGKGRVESSKKHRGERAKIEKENSHSSMESDSRSSNFVFMQGACSVTSNGHQRERSTYDDGENSANACEHEQRFDEGQENAGEDEDASQDDLAADASWEGKEGKSENHKSSVDQDPLLESMHTLQSVQEALENEVKKLREIGKLSNIAESSTLADQGIDESSSSGQVVSENIGRPDSLESEILSLTENVKYLENRLVVAEVMLRVKESMVAELESELAKDESVNYVELQQEKSRAIEHELEGIFKKKIEAEVEYLTLANTIQKLRVAAGDQMTLFEQQEMLAGEQAQMLNKLGQAEMKAAMLMKQAEEIEKYRCDILGTEEVLKLHRRVCKTGSCFFMQLVLLILVFLFILLQLSPQHGGVVPT